MFISTLALAEGTFKALKPNEETRVFYIYVDAGSRLNHYVPSGWMGDYGDLKMNTRSTETVKGNGSCLRFQYSAERKQGAGWTGVYWQLPANNWGDKKGGYDLTGYKTLKFDARGDKGGEYIDKFGMGGISGQMEEGDSDSADSDSIELSTTWKEYSIDLRGRDLSHIIGGFLFVLNADMNPQGATFYVDNIRYEK